MCVSRKKKILLLGDDLGKLYITAKLIIKKKYLQNHFVRTTFPLYHKATAKSYVHTQCLLLPSEHFYYIRERKMLVRKRQKKMVI